MAQTEKTPVIARIDEAARPPKPHLVVLHGVGAGQVHHLSADEAVIGRDDSADIRIDDPKVSRRHARVTLAPEGAFIEDLGSTNGTFVGLRTVRSRARVPGGAVIALGRGTMLRLTYSTYAGARAP